MGSGLFALKIIKTLQSIQCSVHYKKSARSTRSSGRAVFYGRQLNSDEGLGERFSALSAQSAGRVETKSEPGDVGFVCTPVAVHRVIVFTLGW